MVASLYWAIALPFSARGSHSFMKVKGFPPIDAGTPFSQLAPQLTPPTSDKDNECQADGGGQFSHRDDFSGFWVCE